jgi:hypothetical protein
VTGHTSDEQAARKAAFRRWMDSLTDDQKRALGIRTSVDWNHISDGFKAGYETASRETCYWNQVMEIGNWSTQCEAEERPAVVTGYFPNIHHIPPEHSPRSIGMRFCPYCGKRIITYRDDGAHGPQTEGS